MTGYRGYAQPFGGFSYSSSVKSFHSLVDKVVVDVINVESVRYN